MDEKQQKMRLQILEMLAQFGEAWLLRHPDAPKLAASGVQQKGVSEEQLADIGRMIDLGHGDIESLVVWRIAELRAMGIDAQPYLFKPKGSNHWIPAIKMPDGTIENYSSKRFDSSL